MYGDRRSGMSDGNREKYWNKNEIEVEAENRIKCGIENRRSL